MTTTQSIQQLFEATELWHSVGFQYIHAEKGVATLQVPFNTHITNTGGSLHGGIIMMSLDNVMGMAAMSLGFNQVLTMQMETRFLRQGTDGMLTATASVVEQTRSTLIVEGKIRNASNELIAMCTATFKGLK
ncbi:PaaI family thioesterase [Kurthia sibirica]|uniref:Medium/long-chain acyl-CoA thioesterase YigI n=1 Tax=Kurthia sibirica TaxID=202750 RepID=A0A2U3AML5_9BACL|nr:PaaI family thioesterase [Kurthia sibirica]PWI25764.1 PaaI family thioesterase [Kurthia sibirica]GEK35459.1 esterase [Kurthia sibirica]